MTTAEMAEMAPESRQAMPEMPGLEQDLVQKMTRKGIRAVRAIRLVRALPMARRVPMARIP